VGKYLIVPSATDDKKFHLTLLNAIMYIGKKFGSNGRGSNLHKGYKYISSQIDGCNPTNIKFMTRNRKQFLSKNNRPYAYKVHKSIYADILAFIIDKLAKDPKESIDLLKTEMVRILESFPKRGVLYSNALVFDTVLSLHDLANLAESIDKKEKTGIILAAIDKIPRDSDLQKVLHLKVHYGEASI
jgi:hypothetical protein